jgi:hypothetical protein
MATSALYVFWIPALLLECAIVFRLFNKGLFRTYPIFLAYILAHILSFLSLFYAFHYATKDWYRQIYMGCEVVDVILKFGVIGELFSQVFSSYKAVHQLGTTVVRIVSVALVMAALLVAVVANPEDKTSLLSKFFAMERSAEIVQAGLIFLLFALCYMLALQWRQFSLGIALGLCIVTGIYLVVFTFRTALGKSSNQILALISTCGYDFGALIWLLTLYRDPQIIGSPVRSTRPTWDVASWNRTLTELLKR